MEIQRTEEEINALHDECAKYQAEGTSKFRGQSYEDGIRNAIDWLLGDTDEHPMGD